MRYKHALLTYLYLEEPTCSSVKIIQMWNKYTIFHPDCVANGIHNNLYNYMLIVIQKN